MARLNSVIDSDDDFPAIANLLARKPQDPGRATDQTKTLCEDEFMVTKTLESPNPRRQRPLRLAHVNSLLLPLPNGLRREKGLHPLALDGEFSGARDDERSQSKQSDQTRSKELCDPIEKRSSPRKLVQNSLAYAGLLQRGSTDVADKNSSLKDVSTDLVVDNSFTDIEVPPLRSSQKKERNLSSRLVSPAKLPIKSSVVDLTSPKKTVSKADRAKSPPSGPSTVSFEDDDLARLEFCPPHSSTPHRRKDIERPRTPPNSPPKSKLQSPSKRFQRIPPSPHRPSIDAFWSQEIINDWNDQYSPQKLKSTCMLLSAHEDDEADVSPSASPRKSPAKTPGKRDRAAVERRKAFDERKVHLAVDFLKELDDKVAEGRIGALAKSAGGVKIIWSKKLNSTAGRANWKRETLLPRGTDGASMKTYRHHASIELAEKVIDDEERLTNVLAHEYCHLANFMISGVKNNPHGKEFKEWAAKTSRLFGHRNITVTTKHTYAISYKYIWSCSSPACGIEYKRHSKSIDPSKHSCGACKGKLVQIQPAPRKGKRSEGERKGEATLSAYQAYVKSNCARVRRENPGLGLGEVMKRLGEEFRGTKAKKLGDGDNGKEMVEEIEISDDEGNREYSQDGNADAVARQLDFLRLG